MIAVFGAPADGALEGMAVRRHHARQDGAATQRDPFGAVRNGAHRLHAPVAHGERRARQDAPAAEEEIGLEGAHRHGDRRVASTAQKSHSTRGGATPLRRDPLGDATPLATRPPWRRDPLGDATPLMEVRCCEFQGASGNEPTVVRHFGGCGGCTACAGGGSSATRAGAAGAVQSAVAEEEPEERGTCAGHASKEEEAQEGEAPAAGRASRCAVRGYAAS